MSATDSTAFRFRRTFAVKVVAVVDVPLFLRRPPYVFRRQR